MNQDRSQVSVVIPTYNGVAFIGEALASVFVQTLPPAEVIVVDDCSTDGTADLVQGLARTAPVPLRVIRCEHNSGGPARPMNLGVEAATTEVVAFLDQDDIMCEEKVQWISQVLGEDPRVGLAFGQARPMDKSGNVKPPYQGYDIFPKETATLGSWQTFSSLVNHGYRFGGAGGTAVVKRTWRDLRGFNTKYSICWDFDFALRLAVRGWSAAYVPREFYYHRVHVGNLTRAENGTRHCCEEAQVLLDVLYGPDSISPEWSSLIRSKLQGKVHGTAYWSRRRGHYLAALRFYWFALRHRASPLAALAGILKLGLAAGRDAVGRWG